MNNYTSRQDFYTSKDDSKENNYLSMWNSFYIVNSDEFKSIIEKECSSMPESTKGGDKLDNICAALGRFIGKANKCTESKNTKEDVLGLVNVLEEETDKFSKLLLLELIRPSVDRAELMSNFMDLMKHIRNLSNYIKREF